MTLTTESTHDDDVLAKLVSSLNDELDPTFDQIAWAEDEIYAAMRRHPAAADDLFHSFRLLNVNETNNPRLSTEFIYRAHCRELLDRVARGEDTRPGTGVEVCCMLLEISKITPLKSEAVSVLFRLWPKLFPHLGDLVDDQDHREALYGSTIDDNEADSRKQLTVADRVLGEIICRGLHHTVRVTCKYAVGGARLRIA
jgi:hypothetical protein